MKFHPTTATDAYKLVHWAQRPKGLTELMSYGEPRVGINKIYEYVILSKNSWTIFIVK